MKILVITEAYPPHHSGGYSLRCKDVIDGLVGYGHEFVIITSKCPDPSCKLHKKETTPVYRKLTRKFPTRSIIKKVYFDLLDLSLIEKIIKRYRPELIYLWHLSPLSNSILPYLSECNINLLMDEGGSSLYYSHEVFSQWLYFFKDPKDKWLERVIKKIIMKSINILSKNKLKYDMNWPKNIRIYFNCQSALSIAYKKNLPVNNSIVIYSGIPTDIFNFKVRNKLMLPLNILIPGRIEPTKGTRDGINLIELLLKVGIPSNLVIVGDVSSKTYLDIIQNDIREEELEGNIKILPTNTREEMINLYNNADICFFPSVQPEGFSRVPLEAMACGCILFTYGYEGSREIIDDRKTGFSFQQGDYFSMVSIINNLLVDKSLYVNILEKARSNVIEHYSLDSYIDKINKFVQEENPFF